MPDTGNASRSEIVISGKVQSSTGAPIVGATVVLRHGASVVTGIVGDVDGNFTLTYSVKDYLTEMQSAVNTDSSMESDKLWTLRATSIGFKFWQTTIESLSIIDEASAQSPLRMNDALIVMQEEQVQVEGVTVVAEATETPVFTERLVTNVKAMAQRGVSVSNPIEAVRAPEVSRSGSAFSSQIRFYGSSPDYSLNGASIGRDPAHYGMFSVLPSVAISEVGFSDQALSAQQTSPGQVELNTNRSFSVASSGELTLSALEAVGGYRKATGKWFVNAAVRKSVLDKLVDRIETQSDRRTIPPTNFQDVFVSAGVKLSPATSLYLDQYRAQDFLAFNSGATVNNSAGIDAFQHTRNSMYAAQLRHVTPSVILNIKASARFDNAIYRANSTDAENPAALLLDLQDNTTTLRSAADIAFSLGENQITSGVSISNWSAPQLSLSQRNWNFLPPYSTSDNPHYYQGLVNSEYGALDFSSGGTELALFTQFERSVGTWRLQGGIRAQGSNYLRSIVDLLGRFSIAHRFSNALTSQLSVGSYAEAPVSSLLDPYQVLVRKNLSSLRSVTTRIAKVAVSLKGSTESRYDFALFAKSINNLPTLTPYFVNSESAPEALEMRSKGIQRFYGITASYVRNAALRSIFGKRLDVKTGYAFTYSSAQTNGVTTNYSEDSPHRFEMDATYHASSSINISGLFTMRSGNRYTTPFALETLNAAYNNSHIGEGFYESQLAAENSSRFPTHINVNLSVSYHAGSWTTMANIGNAFNRANPIVSANDGFVYDAGILPSLGATYSF